MSVLDFGEFTDRAAELAAIPLYPVASYMPSAPEQDGFCFLYANRAPFVLGGIDPPEQNGGEYYRLDAAKRRSIPQRTLRLPIVRRAERSVLRRMRRRFLSVYV